MLVGIPQREQHLERQSSQLGSPINDSESMSFWPEKEDMDTSGRLPQRLMLYCRPAFHLQIEFSREKELKEGHFGYVLGPPRTGMSITAMAFAVDRHEWDVGWIHVPFTMVMRVPGEQQAKDSIH